MSACKSPNADFNRKVVERATSDAQLAQLIPDRVDLSADLEQMNGPAFWTEMSDDLGAVRAGLTLIPYGWGLIALLLALLAVLNLDRWYTPFGWMATPLLIGGGIMLTFGALGLDVAQPIIQEAFGSGGEMAATALSGIHLAMEGLFGAIRNLSIIAVLLGLGCV